MRLYCHVQAGPIQYVVRAEVIEQFHALPWPEERMSLADVVIDDGVLVKNRYGRIGPRS